MDSYNQDSLDLVKLTTGKDLGALISQKNLEKMILKIYSSMQT